MNLDLVQDSRPHRELMRVPRPADEAFAARVEAEVADAYRRALVCLPEPTPRRISLGYPGATRTPSLPAWRQRRLERLGLAA